MEKFTNLEEKKKLTILNAALQEFAENGYQQASTNRIVKKAGIGKGMLFYYFKSKRELYEYLIEYSMDIIMDEYFRQVDTSEKDFIERLKQAAQVKMKAQLENKQVFDFLGTFVLAKDAELPERLQKKYAELHALGAALMYEGIDQSLIRKDLDADKAFKLIRWSIEGYQNELLQRLEGQKIASIDFEPYWEEFYGYLEILKKSFYIEKEDLA
ncbi:TetR/AcrR family transcriptional regulator [Planococcus shenhongbingii]|uniref:TetR/AcrR family transcriptional regulator n=1 Tax=Planococcus shenhongbingii TaxID=3058398 RepID=A0ABT8NG42_9BACL|nr:TetR/AcrR family transcriptional regulator [Planococcus sp. N017]MDN7246866.1 TetR/AcrR family transcriptional regulator [Planococcus sp. N017]